jgi:hypothetical protein
LYFDIPCSSITAINVVVSNNINKSPDLASYVDENNPT